MNASDILIERPQVDDCGNHARWFIETVAIGEADWSEKDYYNQHETWEAEGFVYFAVIGEPDFTHVKVGFTTSDPIKRVKGMQTGCPYKMRLLGYVFGSPDREAELHDVLRDERVLGEWFEYTPWVADVIEGELSEGPSK